MTRALVAVLCAFACLAALATHAWADPASLLRGLDTDDPAALATNIAAIEKAPTEPGLADVLFAAGRACEDRLHDPARALAIYERITRELPTAGVSIAAERRAKMLLGARDHAREAEGVGNDTRRSSSGVTGSTAAEGSCWSTLGYAEFIRSDDGLRFPADRVKQMLRVIPYVEAMGLSV